MVSVLQRIQCIGQHFIESFQNYQVIFVFNNLYKFKDVQSKQLFVFAKY